MENLTSANQKDEERTGRLEEGMYGETNENAIVSFDEIMDMVEDLETLEERPDALHALSGMIEQFWENLDSYETVISDGASGRLPALVMKRIIDKRKDEKESDHVKFRSIAGGRVSDKVKEAAEERLDNLLIDEKGLGKTLLVTEYMNTGKGITWLAKLMEKRGMDFDIGAVSIAQDIEDYDESVAQRLRVGLSTGGMGGGMSFYGRHSETGVEKKPYGDSGVPHKYEQGSQEQINKTREDIYEFADRLYERLSEE